MPLSRWQCWPGGRKGCADRSPCVRAVPGLCSAAAGDLVAQLWHRFGLGRPAQSLEQRQRASEVNPAQSSLCKAISLPPKHPAADLGGTDVRRRRYKEEPAATSCSRKGHLAPLW